jgi:hypothetical protein
LAAGQNTQKTQILNGQPAATTTTTTTTTTWHRVEQGSIVCNLISTENFSDKFSSPNYGQITIQNQAGKRVHI